MIATSGSVLRGDDANRQTKLDGYAILERFVAAGAPIAAYAGVRVRF